MPSRICDDLMLKYFLLPILLLCACDNGNIRPTKDLDKSHITWERIDADKINAFCTNVIGKESETGEYLGCGIFAGDQCFVYSPMIEYVNDEYTMFLGHEVGHCFLGHYHQVVE